MNKFCPIIKGKCVTECIFNDADSGCRLNDMAECLSTMAANIVDDGMDVNATLYEE